MPSCDVHLSVRSSFCPSRFYILSKRINVSSNFFTSCSHTILVFPYQTGWKYSDRDPLTGASNADGIWKIAIFDQYLASSHVTYGATVRCYKQSVSGPWQVGDTHHWSTKRRRLRLLIAGDGRRSATRQWILFMTGSLDVTPKTAEQNLIVRIGKSDNKSQRYCILLKLTTDRHEASAFMSTDGHEASRGLSATAELASCIRYFSLFSTLLVFLSFSLCVFS